jgi:hypothetical protein
MGFSASLAGKARFCVVVCAVAAMVAAGAISAHAAPRAPMCGAVDYNQMILRIIRALPPGGGYSIGGDFQPPTIAAQSVASGRTEMVVEDGRPSHCSSATYTVFAHLVAELQNTGRISLTAEQIESLSALRTMPSGRARRDGDGPFWIFNSNGAGAAALVKHTGVGFSFRDDKLLYARPGDFLKIFWNENVGATERGHQVIYTGRRKIGDRNMICFWSSQHQRQKRRDGHTEPLYFPASSIDKVHDGYGEVCRPREDIKEMVFSRITCMENLAAGLADMAARAPDGGNRPDLFVDQYLAQIRDASSDHKTLNRTYDIETAPASAFADVETSSLR